MEGIVKQLQLVVLSSQTLSTSTLNLLNTDPHYTAPQSLPLQVVLEFLVSTNIQ